MIKVLVVDDSPVMRELIADILRSDKCIEVIGVASNGKEAVEFVKKNKPDIITMDITMPIMDGLEATQIIMETNPVPIILVTGLVNSNDIDRSFSAVKAGAVSIMEKPLGMGHKDFNKISQNIIDMVKLMSEIKVVRRKAVNKSSSNNAIKGINGKQALNNVKAVAIGVSTGGPTVLQTIFEKLPLNIKIPILVVQHIAPGFLDGLIDWLSKYTKLPIQVASQGEAILPGHIYFAPDGFHMKIGKGGHILLSNGEKENGLKPSVSTLFRSVQSYYGKNSMAILLTGMGKDGALELKNLKDNGAITVAQDKETSVVYGMPGEAAKLNAATYILSPEKIAELIGDICN